MGKKPVALGLVSVLLLCFAPGCATTQSTAAPNSPLTIVEQYLAALNRRDLLVLTAYVAPNVTWYSLVNDERITEVSGREALTKTLTSYFAHNSQTHWAIEQAVVTGQSVAIRERSQWRADDSNGERVSLAVYEILDGRIARISYFLGAP